MKPDPRVAQAERTRVSDAEMTRLEGLFNTSSIHPRDFDVVVNGRTLKADQTVSVGAPVFPGASTPEVMGYYKEFAGMDAMPTVKAIPGKGNVYVATRPDGSKVNLRSFSSSAQQAGAVWTIEIRHPLISNNGIVEIKFK
ncbi:MULTISPECIES: hypothetical protein [Stenotrophomonas]|uniref:Uncharacterized protein n=1 Tax=Stenotrophomonas maltophilia TaxID=40324 RepID=A0A3S0KFH3_STEMA|nr:hypothetical protein [Stenotrophomonas maltophilia]RTQ90127.1 hypothetical protein EKL94_07695 [Stenotrophomonas maltophilia]